MTYQNDKRFFVVDKLIFYLEFFIVILVNKTNNFLVVTFRRLFS